MSDVRCGEFHELVSSFVDEHLDGGELLRLEEHFQSCAGCRTFEAELRRLKGLLPVAEAFRPLRPPPPGFAATVVARIERLPGPQTVPFPEARPRRLAAPVSWLGLAAAAAVAILFFTWSWQRLLDADPLARHLAVRPPGQAVVMAASTGEGNIEVWLQEHAMVARDGTLLGPAEEIEFASFSPASVSER